MFPRYDLHMQVVLYWIGLQTAVSSRGKRIICGDAVAVDLPAHALCQALLIGCRHPSDKQQLREYVSLFHSSFPEDSQFISHALDLHLLGADLLQLRDDVFCHLVLHASDLSNWGGRRCVKAYQGQISRKY